ncbi:MAG: prolyl oligopeptidase [Sphingobacteriales bacterium]|jgi:prolyl oligopeptidase
MKLNWLTIPLATLLVACGAEEKKQMTITYPETKKVDHVDDYFGTKIADPYRWLEIDTAADVKDWVTRQNEVTNNYLAQIPYRQSIMDRFEKLYNYEKYGAPFKAGDNYFFFLNDGLQNQSVLYIQTSLDAEPEVFLDPNKLSDDGTVALSTFSPSLDGKYVVYGTSTGGSDWVDMYVMEVATKTKMSDELNWVKFSGASWAKDGFYYSRYDAPKKGDKLSGKNEFHKVYFHKLGTLQSDDKLVFQDDKNPQRNFYAGTTEDQSFVYLVGSQGTSGNSFRAKNLKAGQKEFTVIVSDFDNEYSVIDNIGSKLLVLTDKDAPRYRLVLIDPKNPAPKNWKEIIPQKDEVLRSVSTAGGKIFANYMKDASSKIYIHKMDGTQESEVILPALGTAGGFGGKMADKEVFYSFSSFLYPSTIYRYNIESGESTLFRKSNIDFNVDDYETKQVFYKSKDGTEIPMFIVHKKGLKMDGNNPTLLYGYGGFNISLTPGFSVSRLIFLENGGIYAQANLRGGGEYGEDWHKAGMLDKKQNVFDDFISAGEYLVKEKYTSSKKLAIEGRSNGGLLVGACMLQRPDLFAVALPGVGVMDMLKYHTFTIGWAWAVEYGSSADSNHFQNLIKYSPVHNVLDGVSYPATLVTTADHDDRVVPAHSFKFISALQAKHKGDNPVLIRVEVDAGHGAGKPTEKIIEENGDKWAFVFENLGMKPIYK